MEFIFSGNLFIKLFDELNISYVLRSSCRSEWTSALSKLEFHSIEYTNLSIDYQLAYHLPSRGAWLDYSMVLMLDGRTIGVWPITLAKIDGHYRLTSQGLPISPVILQANITATKRKSIYRGILTFLMNLCNHLAIKELRFSEVSMPDGRASEWHLALMSFGAKCSIFHELFLDTSESIENIFLLLSPNFKRDYKQGLGLWNTTILDNDSKDVDQIFEQFKTLHYKVSGGSTRSDASWEAQKRYIKAGDSILAYSTQDDGQFVGGGLFFLSPHTCLYASGAYDRQLFKTPVSHVIQIKAIEYFCKKNIPWYRIGRRPFPGDTNEPSTKEISIGQFKERVASHVFPSFEFTLVL